MQLCNLAIKKKLRCILPSRLQKPPRINYMWSRNSYVLSTLQYSNYENFFWVVIVSVLPVCNVAEGICIVSTLDRTLQNGHYLLSQYY